MASRLKLILIRGLPGSGTSTLAKTYKMDHFEADMYFISSRGEYVFQPEKLKQAHAWCRYKTGQSLANQRSVVVSNTFVRLWEMKSYEKLANKYGAKLEIIECKGEYSNIHGVPEKTIETMKSRWQELANPAVKDS